MSKEHSETFCDAITVENVHIVHSPPHKIECDSSSNSSDTKCEQISGEFQADRIQPIIEIKATDSSSTTNNNDENSSFTETSQSNAIEVATTSSSQSHQSECGTIHNDVFDANESGPDSVSFTDLTNLNSRPNNDDAENEYSDGDTNDPIKVLQRRHVRDELDLFCYVCNYGFKSFPRLIRHMETKKHANQVEKYHALNSSHCFNGAGPLAGCNQYRHAYHQRPAPQPPAHLFLPPVPMTAPQHQMLYQHPQHYFQHQPHQYHHLQQQREQQTPTTSDHNEMELLPEDVIDQMISSLEDDIHRNSDAFSEFETTTDFTEMLEYLQ